jgi:hypothetical protein
MTIIKCAWRSASASPGSSRRVEADLRARLAAAIKRLRKKEVPK